MFDLFVRLSRLEAKFGHVEKKVRLAMSLIDDLRAAVAADAAADKAVLDYLAVLKGSVDDLTAKLNAALANAQDPALAAVVQEAVASLTAHSADMAAHVPAPAAPVDIPPAA